MEGSPGHSTVQCSNAGREAREVRPSLLGRLGTVICVSVCGRWLVYTGVASGLARIAMPKPLPGTQSTVGLWLTVRYSALGLTVR